jgi:uncharacterized membrane protein (DUF2068 family)
VGDRTLPARTARTVAVVLLLVEGLSGSFVGFTLVAGVAGTFGLGSSLVVPVGVLAYGLALIAAAFGIWLGRRWGLILGIVVIALGLGLLIVLLAAVGFDDPVLLGGALIWAITLALLLVSRRQPAA